MAASRAYGRVGPLILRRNLDSPEDQPSDTTVTVLEGLRDFFTDLKEYK
jgi:hypothetical protein